MTTLPAEALHPHVAGGILVDITSLKHATIQERLGFELAKFLVDSHTLGDAIANVIHLICKNLGGDWGAHRTTDSVGGDDQRLPCQHFWHRSDLNLGSFGRSSAAMSLASGEGAICRVCRSGKLDWVKNMVHDERFSSRTNDRGCQLWSCCVFLMSCVCADGRVHRPGVPKFYSCLSRQKEAQLPKLSVAIGALIAQMAQRLEQQANILHLAQVDELTERSNRSHFYARLNQACAAAPKVETSFGLLFIDLDRFKPINDAFGHEAGHLILCESALRLRALLPAGASAGRLSGDEFDVLLSGERMSDVDVPMERILQVARTPFAFGRVELTVSAGVGVGTYPQGDKTGLALLQCANAAVCRIKNNGRNGYCFLSARSSSALAQQQISMAQRLAVETELYRALLGDDNALFLVYQSTLNIAIQKLDAVEAWIRWRRPDGKPIVKTIVDLGSHMPLEVITEGVETAPQLFIPQQLDCTLIQGYLIDRLMAIADLLANYPTDPSSAVF